MRRELGRGRFEIVCELGRGGMGTVYEAVDTDTGARLALKTVAHTDPRRLGQLKHEFRSVAELRHRNLVDLYELYVDRDTAFFTMELVRGSDLRSWVRGEAESVIAHADTGAMTLSTIDAETISGPGPEPVSWLRPRALSLNEERLRSALAQLALGLAHLHEHGKVHRDVKPSNALVTADGHVKLLDFGLVFDCTPVRGQSRTASPMAGTVAYMAPEYLHGQEVSPAVDLYALGVLAFELVTGAPPFGGTFYQIVTSHVEELAPAVRSVNPVLAEDLARTIDALLRKDPSERPTAEAVRSVALGHALSEPRRERRPQFVGRQEELAALRGELEKARSDRLPRVMFLVGPSGAGKTALLDELHVSTSAAQAIVYRDRCYDSETISYRAFDRVAEELAADAGADWRTDAMPPHAAALARVFPAFAELAVIDDSAVTDPRAERERAFSALTGLLRRRLRGGAGILAVDDLQWADPASFELLAMLGDQQELPLLVILMFRDEDLKARAPLQAFLTRAIASARTSLLNLPPLAEPDAAALIRSMCPGELDDGVVSQLVLLSGGIPYIAESMARELAQNQTVASRSRLDVAALERSRVEFLEEHERMVAQAVAVAGGSVAYERLQRVTQLAPAKLLSALHGLLATRIVRIAPTSTGGVAYHYYHDRLRQAAYRQLGPERAQELHRAFATSYEADRLVPGVAERLAEHWARAGESSRAAPWANAAAEQAAQQLAFEDAAALYDRALELGLPAEQVQVAAERRARLVLLAGDYGRAATLCRDLAAEQQGLARDQWLLGAAEAQIKLGELDRGIATLEELLASRGLVFRRRRLASLWAPLGPALELLWRARSARSAPTSATANAATEAELMAEVYRVIGSYLSTPYPREAFEYVLRSILHARRRGNASAEACGWAMVSSYLEVTSVGLLRSPWTNRAEAIAERCGDPYAQMVVAAVRLLGHTVRGDWRAMRDASARGERISNELGLSRSWEASFLRTYYAHGEFYAGEVHRSVDVLGGMLAADLPDVFTRSLASLFYARAVLYAGRVDEAEDRSIELAADASAQLGVSRLWQLTLAAEVCLARRDYRGTLIAAEAMRSPEFDRVLPRLPIFVATRHQLLATAHLGLGLHGEGGSDKHAERAYAHARRLQWLGRRSFFYPVALRLKGQALQLMRREPDCQQVLGEAARAASKCGGVIEAAAIAALRGDGEMSATIEWLTAGALG